MFRFRFSLVASLVILLSLVATLVGCGGSGGPAADGTPAGSLGSLTLRISRGDGPGSVRVTGPGEVSFNVSSSTQTAVVLVEDPQSGHPIIAPVSVPLENVAQQTVTIDQVPVGTWLLRLELFDSQNTLVAVGQTQVTVRAGQVASATVTLTPTSSPSVSPSVSPSPSPSASPVPPKVFVYVANYSGDTLTRYESNADGSLTPLSPAVSRPGHNPYRLARDPAGSFLFAIYAGANTVESFVVGTDGSLTTVNAPSLTDVPLALKAHPTLNKLYVGLSGGELDTFSYDPASGFLSLANQSFVSQGITDLEPAPDGGSLFILNIDGLVQQPLDATGIPQGSVSIVDATLQSGELLGDPDGFLYVNDGAGRRVLGFKDLAIAPTPFTQQAVSGSPTGLALHPGRTALYHCGTLSPAGGEVSGFSLSAGALGAPTVLSQSSNNFAALAVRPAADFGYVVGQFSTAGEIYRFSLLDNSGGIGGLAKIADTDAFPQDIEIYQK